jgi:hypothetical protein
MRMSNNLTDTMNQSTPSIWQNLLKAGFLAQDIQENADSPEK